MGNNLLLSTGLVAHRLGLSRERIIALCETGDLEHIRDGLGRRLIPEDAAEALRRKRERARRGTRPESVAP